MTMQLDEFSQTVYPEPATASIQIKRQHYPHTFQPLIRTSVSTTGEPRVLYILCDFPKIL